MVSLKSFSMFFSLTRWFINIYTDSIDKKIFFPDSCIFSFFIPNFKNKNTEGMGSRKRENGQINPDPARGLGDSTLDFFLYKFKSLNLFIHNPGR